MSKPCNCGSGKERVALYDAQNIFVDYVCEDCIEDVKAKYRPEIFTGYDQSDVDEPIEPEDDSDDVFDNGELAGSPW